MASKNGASNASLSDGTWGEVGNGLYPIKLDSTDTDTAKGYSTTTGSAHTSARHDWYAALSASPHSIGSKTQYGLYFTVEYL